jgi:hypothetical protein
MNIEILNLAQHRNGVAAVPFDVVLFHDGESRKLAILFPERGRCAVLDEVKLFEGNIAFGSNSHRGDHYEPHLRKAVNNAHIDRLIEQGYL